MVPFLRCGSHDKSGFIDRPGDPVVACNTMHGAGLATIRAEIALAFHITRRTSTDFNNRNRDNGECGPRCDPSPGRA